MHVIALVVVALVVVTLIVVLVIVLFTRRASTPGDGRGQGERPVRPRRQAGVDGGVVGSDAVAAVAEGRERHGGVRWLMGSKGSDCAKGVSSGRWAGAWEGVGFGRGGGAEIFMV